MSKYGTVTNRSQLDINATSTSIIPQIIGKYSNGEKCYRKGEGNISD
jgi:hypothetical protein